MKPIKKFEVFIKERIVKKQSIDKSRAEFLIKEAENNGRIYHEFKVSLVDLLDFERSRCHSAVFWK